MYEQLIEVSSALDLRIAVPTVEKLDETLDIAENIGIKIKVPITYDSVLNYSDRYLVTDINEFISNFITKPKIVDRGDAPKFDVMSSEDMLKLSIDDFYEYIHSMRKFFVDNCEYTVNLIDKLFNGEVINRELLSEVGDSASILIFKCEFTDYFIACSEVIKDSGIFEIEHLRTEDVNELIISSNNVEKIIDSKEEPENSSEITNESEDLEESEEDQMINSESQNDLSLGNNVSSGSPVAKKRRRDK